jgi:uncharacterized small protein (DUF1192 family)
VSEDDLSTAFKAELGRNSALFALVHEDLSLMSVGDLTERIEALQAEILRTQGFVDKKKSGLSAADALFSFKGR